MTAIATSPVPAFAEDMHEFRPRRVSFDHRETPTHWVPDDPHTTHVINVLHLLLPAGERWFCEVFRAALDQIDDETRRREVKAFIGQEATHARAHDVVVDRLLEQGVDAQRFTGMAERLFGLARNRQAPSWVPSPLRRRLDRHYLLHQVALIAAIEHFTAVMGWWILVGRGLDRAGADAEMMDLLRWHGAEEVEHRSVAFDTYRSLGGGHLRRAVAMLVAVAGFTSLWVGGTTFLLRHDDSTEQRRFSPTRFVRASIHQRLPRVEDLAGAVPRYLAPRYHPSHEGRVEIAVAYLESRPDPTR